MSEINIAGTGFVSGYIGYFSLECLLEHNLERAVMIQEYLSRVPEINGKSYESASTVVNEILLQHHQYMWTGLIGFALAGSLAAITIYRAFEKKE